MTVYLIRHGKTLGNAMRRYIGCTDEPLCPEGIVEAEVVGQNFSVETVFVSTLLRTHQTAAILFPNARQEIVPALGEMDFGLFENRSADDMAEDESYRAWVDGGCLGTCPGGESMAAFSQRVCDGFAQIMETQKKAAVFVTHGGTIMSILERFGRPRKSCFDYHVKNCQGFRCILTPGEGALPFTLTGITLIENFSDIGKE